MLVEQTAERVVALVAVFIAVYVYNSVGMACCQHTLCEVEKAEESRIIV